MKKSRIIAISVLAFIFLLTAGLSCFGILESFENNIQDYIRRSRPADLFFGFFTDIGEAAFVIGITAFFMLLPKTRRRVGAPLSATVISSWLTCTIIKNTVRRQRPLIRFIEIGGYSFPSGHATNNAALYIGIMLLLLKLCKNRLQKATVITICLFFPVMIGASRLYFNAHYFSDVICGWCLGSIIAIVFSEVRFAFFDRLPWKQTKNTGTMKKE